jgi:hypothetical protein
VNVNIRNCARCGQDHNNLEFTRFKGNLVECSGSTWKYWGMCPIHNEPVLLNVVTNKRTKEIINETG